MCGRQTQAPSRIRSLTSPGLQPLSRGARICAAVGGRSRAWEKPVQPQSVGQRLPRSAGHFAGLLRLTASPLCRLQVHLPLPLPCARLPGLLRAPRPGLGPRTGKGHERGEHGVGGVWAGRGPGTRPPSAEGLVREPHTANIPVIDLPASERLLLPVGLSGADSTQKPRPTNPRPRRRALARCSALFTPHFRP